MRTFLALTLLTGALSAQTSPEIVVSVGHAGPPTLAAFAGGYLATGSASDVALVDLSSGLTVSHLPQGGLVLALEASPSGDLIAVGTCDHAVQLWDVKSRTLHRRIALTQECAESVSFSPDGALLATGAYGCCSGGGGGSLQVWDVRTGQLARELAKGSEIRGVVFSKDGRWLAGVGDSGKAWVFEWPSGREIRTYTGLAGAGGSDSAASSSPDGRYMAWLGHRSLRVWDMRSGAQVPLPGARAVTVRDTSSGRPDRVWIEEQVNASTVEFLNDGRLAFVDNDRLIVVTLTAGPVQTIALPESKMEVFGDVAIQQPSRWLRIHPDGQTMAGVYDTRTVLWDSASKRVRDLTAPALTAPTSLQWSRGGALAWADPDSGVRVWNDYSGELVDPAPDIDFAITLAFSPDGERLAVCDYSAIYIVDLQRRRSTSSVDLPDTFRPGVAFAPDGRRVAFQGSDGLAIFDGRFREQVRVSSLDEHTSAEYVAFSPDSRWIAAGLGGRHPMLRVWPTGVGAPVTLDADRATHGPQPPAFSSDSRWLASFRKGQSVVLWAAGSWVRERTLSLSGTGRALSFAPEGSRLAVAGDGEAAIWDASTGRKLVTLTSPGSSQATEIAWSPDGKRVVTAADDGVLRFWGASDGHLIASLFTLASSRDWILVAPDGRFDGSDPALNSVVAWRVGNRVAHDKSLSAGHRVRHLWRSLSSITPGQ